VSRFFIKHRQAPRDSELFNRSFPPGLGTSPGCGLKRLREGEGLTQVPLGERPGYHGFTIAKLGRGRRSRPGQRRPTPAQALGANCLARLADGQRARTRRAGGRRPREGKWRGKK
jgi:hypothetical protein